MVKPSQSIQKTHLKNMLILVILVILAVSAVPENSTPPKYKTFGRKQQVNHTPKLGDLMRIWIVYVGQGDGILIQMPSKFNYQSLLSDNSDESSERIDILIDGGSHSPSNETRMRDFLKSLYPQSTMSIEHAVITHHDSDHVTGLTKILNDSLIGVQYIYHNGLASYAIKDEILNYIGSNSNSISTTNRFMARIESDGETLNEDDLIDGINKLRQRHNDNDFHRIYKNLAKAIIDKEEPQNVSEFIRAREGERFIKDVEGSQGRILTDIELQIIWPQQNLKSYKNNWGKTINGNSLTFRIKYLDFEMLFTGDHHDQSEKALVEYLSNAGNGHLLDCDVLKVPHHGSKYNLKEFVVSNGSQPVLCVASMGQRGFSTSWRHPCTKVIKWAGKAHRFYSTYIHEKKFKWNDMHDKDKRNDMVELKHILIETDGIWFRLVEVDIDANNLNTPPTVQQARRGNGTQWILAK